MDKDIGEAASALICFASSWEQYWAQRKGKDTLRPEPLTHIN